MMRIVQRSIWVVAVLGVSFASSLGSLRAAVPSVPQVSTAITGPGLMYPNPAVNATASAPKVEDFP